MIKPAVTSLMLLLSLSCAAFAQDKRTLSGIIYFTNNTPDDLQSYPVELLTAKKKIIKVTNPDDYHRFALSDIAPGKYLLKLTWPNRCVLWYRIDLTKKSANHVTVLMDADCAHFNGKTRDLPSQ